MCACKNSYKQWSAEERDAVTKKTREAVKNGVISPASDYPCKMCGRGKDEVYRMEYHHESYDDPLKNLVPLCSGCHMKYHRQYLQEQHAKRNGPGGIL